MNIREIKEEYEMLGEQLLTAEEQVRHSTGFDLTAKPASTMERGRCQPA
jgi:hypothetical protein